MLSRALHTENLDLSMIYSLLDATLHSIDNAVISSSNWILELLEAAQNLETAIEEQITQEDISTFQEKIGQCFIHQLRDNITSRLNWPVLHSLVEGQHYKPFYRLRRC